VIHLPGTNQAHVSPWIRDMEMEVDLYMYMYMYSHAVLWYISMHADGQIVRMADQRPLAF